MKKSHNLDVKLVIVSLQLESLLLSRHRLLLLLLRFLWPGRSLHHLRVHLKKFKLDVNTEYSCYQVYTHQTFVSTNLLKRLVQLFEGALLALKLNDRLVDHVRMIGDRVERLERIHGNIKNNTTTLPRYHTDLD